MYSVKKFNSYETVVVISESERVTVGIKADSRPRYAVVDENGVVNSRVSEYDGQTIYDIYLQRSVAKKCADLYNSKLN